MTDAIDPNAIDDGPLDLDTTEATDADELGPSVAEAMTQVEAARADFGVALDELNDATQSALDVPAKIRRNPVKTAALAGGAGFLIFGGPRRTARYVANMVRTGPRDPHEGLLPDEIEQVLRDTGVADDPEVRRALDEDFADYLKSKGRYEPTPGAATSFWRTFDKVAGPLGTVGARIMVQRLMEAERVRASDREEARDERMRRTRKS
jgi:hypothetical protein